VALIGILAVASANGPLSAPAVLTEFYWIYLIWLLIKALIARDIANTPPPRNFWLLPLFPFYKLVLRSAIMAVELGELLRIGVKHPYVPDHVWQEIPWW